MGMYDEVICEYPLPNKTDDDLLFYSRSTPAQMLDLYRVQADGTLWHEDYDIEDQSDRSLPGILGVAGIMTPVNKRWARCDFSGEISICQYRRINYIEYKLTFIDGMIANAKIIDQKS
jgi:hypothetical protein